MRRELLLAVVVFAAGTISAIVACSSAEEATAGAPGSDASLDGTSAGDSHLQPDTAGHDPDGSLVDAGPPRAPPVPRVYAHTRLRLYVFDPVANTLSAVGLFSPPTGMVDLAVEREGGVYVASFTELYSLDASSVAVTRIPPGDASVLDGGMYPNALAFVAPGVLDPSREVLVGYAAQQQYVTIDTATGVMTPVGSLNASDAAPQYTVAGDIVSIAEDNNRTFVAVFSPEVDSGGRDLLAEVDPATGTIQRIVTTLPEGSTWGLGYWAGVVYAFGRSGNVFAVNVADGGTTLVQSLDGGEWYGAGVTSEAPKN